MHPLHPSTTPPPDAPEQGRSVAEAAKGVEPKADLAAKLALKEAEFEEAIAAAVKKAESRTESQVRSCLKI